MRLGFIWTSDYLGLFDGVDDVKGFVEFLESGFRRQLFYTDFWESDGHA